MKITNRRDEKVEGVALFFLLYTNGMTLSSLINGTGVRSC